MPLPDPSARRPPLDVVCAVIEDTAGRILVARRGSSMSLAGKWEFPGGKVESGENPQAALVREIEEELGCTIAITTALTPTIFVARQTSIRLIPFRCKIICGAPVACEHSEIIWCNRHELRDREWASADLPIVAEITEHS
ncbi:MAG: 8-oxo-dGTP diphosphatase [Verrucomicrobiales bacterium]|jgi:8-oxo-dGTP diphosphatase